MRRLDARAGLAAEVGAAPPACAPLPTRNTRAPCFRPCASSVGASRSSFGSRAGLTDAVTPDGGARCRWVAQEILLDRIALLVPRHWGLKPWRLGGRAGTRRARRRRWSATCWTRCWRPRWSARWSPRCSTARCSTAWPPRRRRRPDPGVAACAPVVFTLSLKLSPSGVLGSAVVSPVALFFYVLKAGPVCLPAWPASGATSFPFNCFQAPANVESRCPSAAPAKRLSCLLSPAGLWSFTSASLQCRSAYTDRGAKFTAQPGQVTCSRQPTDFRMHWSASPSVLLLLHDASPAQLLAGCVPAGCLDRRSTQLAPLRLEACPVCRCQIAVWGL